MAERDLRLDFGYCTADALGEVHGVHAQRAKDLAGRFAPVHEHLERGRREGRLGFWQLPQTPAAELEAIRAQAESLRGMADNLVVLGIGGSALGATAVDMALNGVWRHCLPRRQGGMRLFVADNSDPRMFTSLLEGLDLKRTAFNVISKSGSTAETASQFMVVLDRLERALGPDQARRRLVLTTDPAAGSLRPLAALQGFPALAVPPSVGGRYSVLTAVGLLPLACAGHDIAALLAGAGRMAQRCLAPEMTANPAYLFAALAVDFWQRGRNILVMMPYVSDLFGLAQWFAQLWAESLGKAVNVKGETVNLGQTPVAAVGATDQHSQLQLYMEGPQDKLICFVTLDNYGCDLEIPALYPELDAMAYLGGRSMAELIRAEAKATAAALADQGRPSLCLTLPSLDEYALGQVIFLLEAATVAAGALLGIDPLDQPGVELSKKLTYGLMGRPGFESFRQRLDELDLDGRFVL